MRFRSCIFVSIALWLVAASAGHKSRRRPRYFHLLRFQWPAPPAPAEASVPSTAAPTSTPWHPPEATAPVAPNSVTPPVVAPNASAAPPTPILPVQPAAPAATSPAEPLPMPADTDQSTNVAAEASGSGDVLLQPEPNWYEKAITFMPHPWDTGIELGLNGSSGTNDAFSLRTGGYIRRESRFSKLDLSTYYNRTTSGGVTTQNNAQFDARNDWLLDDSSPWTLFGLGTVFYDQFQTYNLQTNADSGIGYRFLHEKDLQLVGRAGAGASREFGGPENHWVPESIVGFEYSQQLSATQKFYGKLDYYPSLENFNDYRLVGDVGWEVVLDSALEPEPENLRQRPVR